MGGLQGIHLVSTRLLYHCPFLALSSVSTASGDCYTFGSNQHGQLGTSSRHVSRAPCRVQGLEGIKMVMVACGDAFTVAVGAGEGGQDAGGPRQEYGGLYSPSSLWRCSCCPMVMPPSFQFLAEGEVYSWGKGTRGRLGRRDEDAGLPRPVQLDETHPYMVTSVSCCHGNTLLAVRCEFSSPISPTPLG